MAINIEDCISRTENRLQEKGFNLNEAPLMKEYLAIFAEEILEEVKKATVTVPAQGLSTSQGPVTGQANGTIS